MLYQNRPFNGLPCKVHIHCTLYSVQCTTPRRKLVHQALQLLEPPKANTFLSSITHIAATKDVLPL